MPESLPFKFTGDPGDVSYIILNINYLFYIGNVGGSLVWNTQNAHGQTAHTFTEIGEFITVAAGGIEYQIRWEGFGSLLFSMSNADVLSSSSSSVSNSSSSSATSSSRSISSSSSINSSSSTSSSSSFSSSSTSSSSSFSSSSVSSSTSSSSSINSSSSTSSSSSSVSSSSASPFAPAQLSGLHNWYDASQEAYSNDATVTNFHDQSGNNRDLSKPDNNHPTFKTNVLNGKSVVRYDASNNEYNWGEHIDPNSYPVTYSVVAQADNLGTLLWTGASTGDTAYTTIRPHQFYTRTNHQGSSTMSWASDDSPHVITIVMTSSTDRKAYVDGVLVDTDTTAIDWTNGHVAVGVNRRASITDYFTGDVAEVTMYTQALSTGDRNLLENYLGEKYGITIRSSSVSSSSSSTSSSSSQVL